MFPIGGFTKDVVKKFAETSGFERIAKKRESMGICFIGKRKNGFAEFIQARFLLLSRNNNLVINFITVLLILFGTKWQCFF
jgi:tRNA U34 2-thiouridine synthase MnmA/TrmU